MRISDWSSDVCSSDLADMGQLDSRPDGVDVDPADRHDQDSYPKAEQALTRQRVPILIHADNPHERLFIAALDGTGNSMSKDRSEEHTSELQSLMRNSYAVFFLKKKK